MRASGILYPVSSLPSRYGIGCFSIEAYEFIDFLYESGQTYWQVLPFGPTGFGDSPYQSFSTFAGNPYFIAPDQLIDQDFLTREECDSLFWGSDPERVDYDAMYQNRFRMLRTAYHRFRETEEENEPFQTFVRENRDWLEDYCLFMALKEKYRNKLWTEWDMPYRNRDHKAMAVLEEVIGETVDFFRFQQFEFMRQWKKLRAYANDRGIRIIGDIPFYVAFDSADTWAHPEMFSFDEEYEPTKVAGCPPDAFSSTGQLWGNPVYDWDYLARRNYDWWIRRIARCMEFFDVIRIDHFRGFDEYFSIPAGDTTAKNGHWEKGPGMDFFRTLYTRLGDVNVIAEDLGLMTDGVRRLVRDSGCPNMKVLQFAVDPADVAGSNDYWPHNYNANCVVYTGTHDNETVAGWYQGLSKAAKQQLRDYLCDYHTPDNQMYRVLIALTMRAVAKDCIIPVQDYLGLGNEARMNQPGTVGFNWRWRLTPGQLTDTLAEEMLALVKRTGRANWDAIEKKPK